MKKTYIIAEAGVNHNNDINLAKRMIETAKKAGADAVKFQTFCTESLVSKSAKKADYQISTTNSSESQFDMIKKLELSYESHIEIKLHCEKVGITFLSTPFDIESIMFLQQLGIAIWKIPSGEITNLPYLIEIAKTKKKVIMSTGMCNMDEIAQAIDILRLYDCHDITLLHCNTEYPTPFEDVNLTAMVSMKSAFNVKIGYSDHTLGIEVPIAAVAMGAEVIEKHFTLDRNLAGPDHKASLLPEELQQMVRSIRNVETSLGSGLKIPSQSESKNIYIARKSIVAKEDIKEGEIYTSQNITTKRPGNGISPMKWFEILGTTAKRDFVKDEMIEV